MQHTDTTDRRVRGVMNNFGADAATRTLLGRAAEQPGENRSECTLDVARREAVNVLLDRRLFLLDDKSYRQFVAALDRPPAENRRLRPLLVTKAAWDE